MIKSLDFTSMIAYDIWLELNEPFVEVVSMSVPDSEFGYEVSARLQRPKITIKYIEFPRET